ncbi:MAG TPA: transglycosylase SLT domain-containing protein [Gemmatimonadales bacterium]
MSRLAVPLLLALAARAAAGQAPLPTPSAARAESLAAEGRPWHAAEALVATTARSANPSVALVLASARAELAAHRYERGLALLVGQPWIADSADGDGLALLADAELHVGRPLPAALHFSEARAHASGPRAALLAVRAAHAFAAGGAADSAARYYAAARRAGLSSIDGWLRVRQAEVTGDTAVANTLLAGVPWPAAREAPRARARSLLAAGDSAGAQAAFAAAGARLEGARLAIARRDTAGARLLLYELQADSPESDDAAAAVPLVRASTPPRAPAERVALAHALRTHGAAPDALDEVQRAVAAGDSSPATLLFAGELLALAHRDRESERTYLAAARDSALRPLATYRRARVLVRLGDAGAIEALAGFAETYPADTAAPTALYLAGDLCADRGDSAAADRWFGAVIARYPTDLRASLARFRLALRAARGGDLDSAAALFRAEVDSNGPSRMGARFWLGRLAATRGDSGAARTIWLALAHDDSIGYYGLRARDLLRLPPLAFAGTVEPDTSAAVGAGLARIDTLLLAGLDTAAETEVRAVVARPPDGADALLAWSDGLAERGWGTLAVRLGWQAAARRPADVRALRAIFPWPDRRLVEEEAAEFSVDPLLLAALVRQESVFDREALSRAGARGLAQLLPSTAAQTARGLDLSLAPEWITVPDLNLHLGAAHLAALLRRFPGRVDAAIAAYNAGVSPVARWLARPGAEDPDQFLEQIPFQETRGYVRTVTRNWELYRALYAAPR